MDGIVGAPLRQSVKADLDQLRAAGKNYTKSRERLERVVHRAEPAGRQGGAKVNPAENELSDARQAYENSRLLYRNKLAMVTDKKAPEFGATLWKVLGVRPLFSRPRSAPPDHRCCRCTRRSCGRR